MGLVPLGGADKLDQENFHHDSRDDNDLDVSKILRVDEVLEHHVFEGRLAGEVLGQYKFFDLCRKRPEEIVDMSQSIFDTFALLSVRLPLQKF